MKLDISCVRAILQTVEKYETIYEAVTFKNTEPMYYKDYLDKYTVETVLYHVQYCIKAGLLSDVHITQYWGVTAFDCCLEPLGHDFLSNINTEEKWSKLLPILDKIGGASLNVITAIAEGVTTALVNQYAPAIITRFTS